MIYKNKNKRIFNFSYYKDDIYIFFYKTNLFNKVKKIENCSGTVEFVTTRGFMVNINLLTNKSIKLKINKNYTIALLFAGTRSSVGCILLPY